MATYAAGTIVFFYHQAELRLGMICAADNSRWRVLDLEGASQLLAAERFVLCSRDQYLPPEATTLADFAGKIELSPVFLEQEIPLLLSQLEPNFSFDQAAEKIECFGDPCRFAFYRYLRSREDLFTLKKGRWRVRSEVEIAEFEAHKDQAEARAGFLHMVAERLQRIKEEGIYGRLAGPEPSSSTQADFERQLAAELRGLLISNEPKDLARTMRAAGVSLENGIRALRLSLGDILQDTDPVAADSGIPISFPAGLEKLAARPEVGELEDCEPFTIDADDSSDLDDAISWQETASGWCLGIHISDLTAWIQPGGELWSEAESRVSSLYLPSQTIPLLPAGLSDLQFSLLANKIRPVLSLFVELDRDGAIREHSFRKSWVRIRDNLSYEELDRQLQSEKRSPLLELCLHLHAARMGENEERKPRYSWNLKVIDGVVSMQRVDNLSPARFMVEELMILYNRLLAEKACQNSLPLIYRNILQFGDDEDEDSDNLGIQAYLDTEARFHPGIGARAYLHATSPIRRFTDMVNQAQFSALLEGRRQFFTRRQLDELIPHIGKRLQYLRAVARRSERYWLLRWLEQKHLGEPLDAVLLRRVKQGFQVELSRWEKRLVLRCEPEAQLQTPVKVVIAGVDLEEQLAWGDVIL